MTNYSKFEGKLIRMNKPYPITNDEDEILGYTEVGDMAVITFAEIGKEEGYFETVLVSGKFIGVDSLALDLSDIMESIFIFNNKDNNGTVTINSREVKYAYVC